MSKVTTLAESQITPSPHNVVTVELIEADGMPLWSSCRGRSSPPCCIHNASPMLQPPSRDCSPAPLPSWPQSRAGGSCEESRSRRDSTMAGAARELARGVDQLADPGRAAPRQ
jgi:hypothetical protein